MISVCESIVQMVFEWVSGSAQGCTGVATVAVVSGSVSCGNPHGERGAAHVSVRRRTA